MIGHFRSSKRSSNPSSNSPPKASPALAEIEVMRIDATLRALPDHDDRPNGPSTSIDRSLMAAATIQASINRQRRRPVETPTTPAPSHGLTWLASLSVFVIALIVLGLAWEVGEKAYYDPPESATLTVATEAGLAPATPATSLAPATRLAPATPVAPPVAVASVATAPASTSTSTSGATPVQTVASIEGRRALHTRERPTARHFPASDTPLIIPKESTSAATDATDPTASPAWQAWTQAPLLLR